MEVAKLFGSLGFKVDTSGLKEFQKAMGSAREELRHFATDSKIAERNVKDLTTEVLKLKKSLNFKVSTTGVKKAFVDVRTAVQESSASFSLFSYAGGLVESRLSTLDTKLNSSIPLWERYRKEVEASAIALHGIRGSIPTANTAVNSAKNNNSSTGTTNNPRSFTSNNTGINDRNQNPALYLGGLTGGNFFNTARQAIMGGLATALPFALGGMTKSVISTGRDLRSADQVLLAHSEDMGDYKYNKNFIRKLAMETGADLTESTRGYGRVLNSARAGGADADQAQRVFEAFLKYGTTMHMGADENQRMLKALEQIYTNGRILGQEINQFANVGIPMKAILKSISNGDLGAGSKEVVPEEIKKLAGSKAPDTVKLADWIAKYMTNVFMNNDAYLKAQQSSQTKQGQAKNEWGLFSEEIMENGGDKALASFFQLLRDTVTAIRELTTAIREISKAFDKVTGEGGSNFLWLALALLIPIGRLGKGVSILGRALALLRGRFSAIALMIGMSTRVTGGLIARIILLGARAIGLFNPLTWLIGLMWAFVKVGEAINESNTSINVNWVDRLSAKFLSARASLALLANDMRKTFDPFYKTVEEGDGRGFVKPSVSTNLDPTRWVEENYNSFNKAQSEFESKQNFSARWARDSVFEKERNAKYGGKSEVKLVNNIYVDGKYVQSNAQGYTFPIDNLNPFRTR